MTTINLICFGLAAPAQEKPDKDKQGKLLSKKFATEIFVNRDRVKAAKLTVAPFLEVVQGLERNPTVIKKSANVEKHIQVVVKNYKNYELTIGRVFDTSNDWPAELDFKGVFNKQKDRAYAVVLSRERGFNSWLVVFVSWREDHPQVVGYGIYDAR